jgi:acyl-CoA reductase-like NAD-dependent aldehyde dehydrogenase/nicotinamidase-related amidase
MKSLLILVDLQQDYRPMPPVLLLVDVQNEFLEDPRLDPPAATLLPKLSALLRACRDRGVPIVHAHYITEPDGRGLKVHHMAARRQRCARGTPGAAAPAALAPRNSETLITKHTYSAFSTAELTENLSRLAADTIVIVGLYAHNCVRQTALDALDHAYRVVIVADAIASNDPLHAEVTRSFLIDRGVEYVSTIAFVDRLDTHPSIQEQPGPTITDRVHPVACIDGRWLAHADEPLFEHRNPSHWDQVLGYLPLAGLETVDAAARTASKVQHEWKRRPLEQRIEAIAAWADILQTRTERLTQLVVEEVGKPLREVRIEMARMIESIRVAIRCFTEEPSERYLGRSGSETSRARRCPVGVIAIITPWNNPVFLPACKIAAAVALGNGVVWKPALECPRTSIGLQESLLQAGIPSGLANLVFGGAATAQALIALRDVAAVTLTGSIQTGKQVAAACGARIKPLQAELGGNNAVLVTESCDRARVAREVATHAFAYAGQGCTATRRLILSTRIADEFLTELRQATCSLVVGDPAEEATVVGPLISKAKQRSVQRLVAETEADGAQVFEAAISAQLTERGCWVPPRIVEGLDDQAPLLQEETFAPILVVKTWENVDQAFQLCNGVPHGLVASIYCDDDEVMHEQFLARIETGVVRLNLPTRGVQLTAPFGGWKESGLGPPEHGVWDLDFYTRWQAVYEGDVAPNRNA